eukprot:scaffold7045_cov126-Isochrysis_galbana.AAC.5
MCRTGCDAYCGVPAPVFLLVQPAAWVCCRVLVPVCHMGNGGVTVCLCPLSPRSPRHVSVSHMSHGRNAERSAEAQKQAKEKSKGHRRRSKSRARPSLSSPIANSKSSAIAQ